MNLEITRFHHRTEFDGTTPMSDAPDGEYVLYADHEKIVKSLLQYLDNARETERTADDLLALRKAQVEGLQHAGEEEKN